MLVPSKYAVVERERRFLVEAVPDGVVAVREITDRYVTGTRLRLREVREGEAVVRKLGHKVRLGDGPAEVACTNLYLDDAEWAVLQALPGATLSKTRHLVERDGWRVAVDEHPDGTLVAEVDDGDGPSSAVPRWLRVVRDVSDDEAFTGAGLASHLQ
jgi:CYTH domain-containing protein